MPMECTLVRDGLKSSILSGWLSASAWPGCRLWGRGFRWPAVSVSVPCGPGGSGLTHLGLPAEFRKFKPAPQASLYEHACGLPDDNCQLGPRVDYEAVEPAPADDW